MYDSDKRHCDNLTKKNNNLKNSWLIKKDIIWKYKTPSSSTMLYSDDVVIVAWRKLQSKPMLFHQCWSEFGKENSSKDLNADGFMMKILIMWRCCQSINWSDKKILNTTVQGRAQCRHICYKSYPSPPHWTLGGYYGSVYCRRDISERTEVSWNQLFKASEPMIFSDCHQPVSTLPLFAKILESLSYTRLLSFINKYKILHISSNFVGTIPLI